MIATSDTATAQAEIDRAIRSSLRRLRQRAASLGEPAASLSAAVERAAAGGKRFRPALVVAAFETLGGDTATSDSLYPVAAAFELLHTAFVVHDDVIDHDIHRRGELNVVGEFRQRATERGSTAAGAALLGDAAGILAGDLLLHEATRLIAQAEVTAEARADLLAVLDDAVLVSVAGELADVENAVAPRDSVDADVILGATRDKTAVYSFSAPLQAGAILAGAPTESTAALRRFGETLGLAFQLIDDLIGAFGSSRAAGRGEGGDLREAKQTPLIALARESDHWPQVNYALTHAHTGPVAVRAAQRALTASGARERLEKLVADTLHSARAVVSASLLPDGARAMLSQLVDAVEERVP